MTATQGEFVFGPQTASGFPAYVGHWIVPGANFFIMCHSRPSWFHRLANRVILGWVWEDEK